MQKDAFGGATENEFSNPRVAVRPHDQQIGLVLGDIVLEDVSDRVTVGPDVLRNDFDAVSRKVLRQLHDRLRFVDRLIIYHGKHANLLSPFKKWQGVGDGARCGRAEVPRHSNVVQKGRKSAVGVFGKGQNRTPRGEDELLCDVPLGCIRAPQRDHGQVVELSFAGKVFGNFEEPAAQQPVLMRDPGLGGDGLEGLEQMVRIVRTFLPVRRENAGDPDWVGIESTGD